MWRRTVFLILTGAMATYSAAASDVPRMVVFDLELYDTSGQPPQLEQDERLRLLTNELRQSLAASGRYAVAAAILPPGLQLYRCNGCGEAEAAKRGADLMMMGLVQKVSSLILNLTLTIREVPSGAVHSSWTADFRGNTDESWRRALQWLLRHRVLSVGEKQAVP